MEESKIISPMKDYIDTMRDVNGDNDITWVAKEAIRARVAK